MNGSCDPENPDAVELLRRGVSGGPGLWRCTMMGGIVAPGGVSVLTPGNETV